LSTCSGKRFEQGDEKGQKPLASARCSELPSHDRKEVSSAVKDILMWRTIVMTALIVTVALLAIVTVVREKKVREKR
jgi:hypothetical protein